MHRNSCGDAQLTAGTGYASVRRSANTDHAIGGGIRIAAVARHQCAARLARAAVSCLAGAGGLARAAGARNAGSGERPGTAAPGDTGSRNFSLVGAGANTSEEGLSCSWKLSHANFVRQPFRSSFFGRALPTSVVLHCHLLLSLSLSLAPPLSISHVSGIFRNATQGI